MWQSLADFVMLDAGREVRHRAGTLALFGAAGFVALLALLFALLAAQHYLAEWMPPHLASLVVAAGLLVLAGLILLASWLRQRHNRTGGEIGRAMLATVPLAGAVIRTVNPQMLVIAAVLVGAAVLGNRFGRKG